MVGGTELTEVVCVLLSSWRREETSVRRAWRAKSCWVRWLCREVKASVREARLLASSSVLLAPWYPASCMVARSLSYSAYFSIQKRLNWCHWTRVGSGWSREYSRSSSLNCRVSLMTDNAASMRR